MNSLKTTSGLYTEWASRCKDLNKSVTNIGDALVWAYSKGLMETSIRTDKDLADELRSRGYVVKATKTQIIEL